MGYIELTKLNHDCKIMIEIYSCTLLLQNY